MEEMTYQQPNSRHCFVCGIQNPFGLQLKFYDNGIDKVWTEYIIPEYFQGYPGVAHGGVIAAMLDEVCSRTAMISDSNHFMMTEDITLIIMRIHLTILHMSWGVCKESTLRKIF